MSTTEILRKGEEKREKHSNKNILVYYRMCYFPAGNGKTEVKDNNKSVGEGRIWRTGKERRKQTAPRQRQSEWQATARGCLGSGCSDPLTFTEWPISPCHPPLEKFKRTQIHRGNATACGLTHSLISLQAAPPSLCVTAVSLSVCASVCFMSVSYLCLHSQTTKDRFPLRLKHKELSLCPCIVSLCVLSCPGRQVGREVWEPWVGKDC